MPDTSKPDFDKANPEYFKDLQGDKAAIDRLQQIEREAQQERLQAAETINEKRETWLNEERQKIAYERQQAGPTYDPPGMAKKSIEQEAQERVSLRAQGVMAEAEANRARRIEELTKLPHATHAKAPEAKDAFKRSQTQDVQTSRRSANQDKSHMQSPSGPNGELAQSTKPHRPPATSYKKEQHRIPDRVRAVRQKVSRHYYKMRDLFIGQAHRRGAADPVQEVLKNYQKRQERVHKAHHRLVDKAYREHGIDQLLRGETRSGPTNSGPSMQG